MTDSCSAPLSCGVTISVCTYHIKKILCSEERKYTENERLLQALPPQNSPVIKTNYQKNIFRAYLKYSRKSPKTDISEDSMVPIPVSEEVGSSIISTRSPSDREIYFL